MESYSFPVDVCRFDRDHDTDCGKCHRSADEEEAERKWEQIRGQHNR